MEINGLVKKFNESDVYSKELLVLINNKIEELRSKFYELSKKYDSLEDYNDKNKVALEMGVVRDDYNLMNDLFASELNKKVSNASVMASDVSSVSPRVSVNADNEKESEEVDESKGKSKDEKDSKDKKSMKNGTKALIAAAIVAAFTVTGALVANKKKNSNSLSSQITVNNVNEENRYDTFNAITNGNNNTTSIDINNTNASTLINMLNANQRVVWGNIYDFQNYFNNVAANTVAIPEDGDARLYLTAEECIAIYARINANRYNAEELAGIFGSESYFFNEENMDEKFINACKVMNYYYMTAVQTSGLASMFKDQSDAELFRQIEDLVLEFNKDIKNNKNRVALHDAIMNLYFDGSIDNAKYKHPGVLSLIGTGMAPILYLNDVFTQNELDRIVEMNGTVTCDILRRYESEAFNIKTKTENQEILNILPKMFDRENVRVSSRDTNFEARYNKLRKSSHGFGGGSYTVTETESKEVTREQAVSEFGEETVKKAEEEAKKEAEAGNQPQIDYGKGLDAAINSGLYDDIYDQVIKSGTSNYEIPDVPTTGNDNYDDGVKDATEVIVEYAIEDASIEVAMDQIMPQENYYVDDGALDDDFALMLR